MNIRELDYIYCVIEGTAYEAGKQLGEFIGSDKELMKMVTTETSNISDMFRMNMDRYESICPGINDEIRGFADSIGICPEQAAIYFAYLCPTGNCSQMALRPEMTDNGHCLLGRNYDYSWNDRPILLETHIDGKFKQIGFACQLFGRFDGMNERGLCISTSAGVINPDYKEEGFVFPMVVRAILNCCTTVDEAVKKFESLTFADYRNFMIIDGKGDSVLIEAAGRTHTVTRGPVLYITNHYITSPLSEKDYYKPVHSIERYKCIEKYFNKRNIRYSKTYIKSILSKAMPEGVCCHYFEDGMGTMWSIVFDSSTFEAEICFGPSDDNIWYKYDLRGQRGKKVIKADLRNLEAPLGFWEHSQEK